jgi:hypothetical protein
VIKKIRIKKNAQIFGTKGPTSGNHGDGNGTVLDGSDDEDEDEDDFHIQQHDSGMDAYNREVS